MNWQSLKDNAFAFAQNHGKLLIILAGMLGSFLGVKFTIEHQPVPTPEVHVVLPDGLDLPDVFGADAGADKPWSRRARFALRSAERMVGRETTADAERLSRLLRRIDADPTAFEQAEAAAKASQAVAGDPWSTAAKLALKVAIAVLEARAPNTPNTWDDRLLAFLKLLDGNSGLLAVAADAAKE